MQYVFEGRQGLRGSRWLIVVGAWIVELIKPLIQRRLDLFKLRIRLFAELIND
ncbi:hypothetical protein [Fuerstiella marisgermanici]|uniref:hypothetical protein n=1 Tax=Fuerstiella marisgermanici TaxID=1891926 RepID=UPI001473C249|nr:hypothetical protein [Fuerstiella marisgermanici]